MSKNNKHLNVDRTWDRICSVNGDFSLVWERFLGGFTERALSLRLAPADETYGTPDYDEQKDVRRHNGFKDFSRAGFRGRDENLVKVVNNDWYILAKNRVPYSDLATHMRFIGRVGLRRDFEVLDIQPRPENAQSCPWECKDVEGGESVTIISKRATEEERTYAKKVEAQLSAFEPYNLALFPEYKNEVERRAERSADETARINTEVQTHKRAPFYAAISPLSVHLVERHCFFQGYGSPFRADPGFLMHAFGIESPRLTQMSHLKSIR